MLTLFERVPWELIPASIIGVVVVLAVLFVFVRYVLLFLKPYFDSWMEENKATQDHLRSYLSKESGRADTQLMICQSNVETITNTHAKVHAALTVMEEGCRAGRVVADLIPDKKDTLLAHIQEMERVIHSVQ